MTFTLNEGFIRLSFVVLTILLWVGIHWWLFPPTHDPVIYWADWVLSACFVPLIVAAGAVVVFVIYWVIEGFMRSL